MSHFDENALRALFDELETPAGIEDKWRTRIATMPADEVRWSTDAIEPLPIPLHGPRPHSWLRAAAAGVAVMAAVGIVIGVAASSRRPPTDPEPTITETITQRPSVTSTMPAVPSPPTSVSGAPGTSGVPATGAPNGTQQGQPGPKPGNPAAIAPARGPLSEWPETANVGVPAGTTLGSHTGDLHITTPGMIVHDLRVDGEVFVEAANVTLRRVIVAPRTGASAGVRQRAPGLRIEDSEIGSPGYEGQPNVLQEAAGLTVQRSDLHGGSVSIQLSSDATVVDSLLQNVVTSGNNTRLVLRHNTINDSITLGEQNGPVVDVRIENNSLGSGAGGVIIRAPGGAGSHDIRVTGNSFRRSGSDPIPSSGWNAQAPGNTWTGNVWFGTSEEVKP